MAGLRQLLDNPNTVFFRENDGSLHIAVESYNIALVGNPDYVDKLFRSIVKHKDDILKHFGVNSFAITIEGYCIDGLYESNSLLIQDDSVAECIYDWLSCRI